MFLNKVKILKFHKIRTKFWGGGALSPSPNSLSIKRHNPYSKTEILDICNVYNVYNS